MVDLHEFGAGELASEIAAGRVSSREALDHFVDRVDRIDGPHNSVVILDVERAREVAAAADRAVVAGEALAPLHGVPMTVKDTFATGGLRTTWGTPALAEHVPSGDATAVAKLRAAGAVIFGKTNVPLGGGDFQTYNDIFGRTNNPHDVTRTPGGSSGGAAVALATGLTPLEIGSDIGGSIRIPAHWTGVMGHKASYGLIPFDGPVPGLPGSLRTPDLVVAGPLARTVDDLELALGIVAGPDRWQSAAWSVQLPPPPEAPRVTRWFDDSAGPVDPEVRTLLDRAADAVGASDARPEVDLGETFLLFRALLSAAMSGGHGEEPIDRMAAAEGDDEAGRTRRWTAMRHAEWIRADERRQRFRLQMADFFERWDALLLPVVGVAAIEHQTDAAMVRRRVIIDGQDRSYFDLLTWIAPAGLAYLPATVVPVGRTRAGLPVGIQIVGPFLGDRTTLAVARSIADRCGGCAVIAG